MKTRPPVPFSAGVLAASRPLSIAETARRLGATPAEVTRALDFAESARPALAAAAAADGHPSPFRGAAPQPALRPNPSASAGAASARSRRARNRRRLKRSRAK